jgi:hypothetical protein
MIETIWMIEPWHWLVLGFLLMIAEMFIPTFASLWFGTAAVIVAALSWLLPIPLMLQVLIWLALSVLFMFAWVKYIKPLSVDRTKAGLGGSVIIGETGMIVVKPQPEMLGRVRFSVPIVGADEWFCRTNDEEVEVGDRVVVTDIIGNELIVALTKRIAAPIIANRPSIDRLKINDVDCNEIKHSKLSLHKTGLDRARLKKKFTDN